MDRLAHSPRSEGPADLTRPRGPAQRARERELWILFLVAFSLRLAAMFVLDTPEDARDKSAWEWGWEPTSMAESLLEDGPYGDPFGRETGASSWLTPIYPGLLALCMKLFGGVTPATAIAVFVLQALASAAICLLLCSLGAALGELRAGRVAAWIFALHPAAVWYSIGRAWDSTFIAAGMTAFLVLLLRTGRSPSLKKSAVLGAAYGGLAFLNPAPIAILPAALWYLAPGRPGRASLLRVGAFLGTSFLICLPWLIRNQVELGSFALRTNLGVELRVGNNDLVDGRFAVEHHPSRSAPELERYVQLGEAAYVKEAQRTALEWIREHPGRFAVLCMRRAEIFWFGEIPTRDSRTSWELKAHDDPQAWVKWITNLITGALAIVAFLVFLRPIPERLLLLSTLLLFPCVYYLTHVSERYRFPIDPVLIFLDAWLLLTLWDRWRAKRKPAP